MPCPAKTVSALQRDRFSIRIVVIVPANSFKFTRGRPRYHFTASAAIGHHKRGFCAKCGSRLTGGENREGTSPIVGINAGCLDDPSWFRPQHHIFTSDAQPWDHMDPTIPKYEQYPLNSSKKKNHAEKP
jgi:hypothetical protein